MASQAYLGSESRRKRIFDAPYLVAALLETHAVDSVAGLPGNNERVAAEYVRYQRIGVEHAGRGAVQLEEGRRFIRLAHRLNFESVVRSVITRTRAGRRSLRENRARHRETSTALGVGFVAVVELPHRALGEFREVTQLGGIDRLAPAETGLALIAAQRMGQERARPAVELAQIIAAPQQEVLQPTYVLRLLSAGLRPGGSAAHDGK